MTEREMLKGRKEQLLADDAGWITGEVPERNGWYDCKVRRRNPKCVLDPEHEPEYIYDLASCLYRDGKFLEYPNEFVAWREPLKCPDTCGKPIISREGAIRLAIDITAGIADELVEKEYTMLTTKSRPLWYDMKLKSESLRRLIQSEYFSRLSLGADPDEVIANCIKRAERKAGSHGR